MKKENTSQMMTANHWEDGQSFTTTQLILLILTAIVFVGSTLYLLPMPFMANGVQIDHSIKLPVPSCQPLAAQGLPPSITERQSDYLICLKKEMKR